MLCIHVDSCRLATITIVDLSLLLLLRLIIIGRYDISLLRLCNLLLHLWLLHHILLLILVIDILLLTVLWLLLRRHTTILRLPILLLLLGSSLVISTVHLLINIEIEEDRRTNCNV